MGSSWDIWKEADYGRAHARMAARRLLVEAGITCLPVNPFRLLRNYRSHGIDAVDIQWVAGVDIDGWSGYLAKHRRYAVFINSTRSYVKSRWTGAHELGHAVLRHSLHPIDSFDVERDPEEEREADIFAEELLIPTPFLHAVLKKHRIQSIHQLTAIFHVSKESMAIALEKFMPKSKIEKLMAQPSIPISYVEFIDRSTRVPVSCPHCGTLLYPTKRSLVSVCSCGLEIHYVDRDFAELTRGRGESPLF